MLENTFFIEHLKIKMIIWIIRNQTTYKKKKDLDIWKKEKNLIFLSTIPMDNLLLKNWTFFFLTCVKMTFITKVKISEKLSFRVIFQIYT